MCSHLKYYTINIFSYSISMLNIVNRSLELYNCLLNLRHKYIHPTPNMNIIDII